MHANSRASRKKNLLILNLEYPLEYHRQETPSEAWGGHGLVVGVGVGSVQQLRVVRGLRVSVNVSVTVSVLTCMYTDA
jgi:hypothetical protein